MDDDYRDDRELTAEQRAAVEQLTADDLAEIDAVLLSHVTHSWRKVARVIGETMLDRALPERAGIPDVFFAERIRGLARMAMIESVGNLRRMRYSEVRKQPPAPPKETLH